MLIYCPGLKFDFFINSLNLMVSYYLSMFSLPIKNLKLLSIIFNYAQVDTSQRVQNLDCSL